MDLLILRDIISPCIYTMSNNTELTKTTDATDDTVASRVLNALYDNPKTAGAVAGAVVVIVVLIILFTVNWTFGSETSRAGMVNFVTRIDGAAITIGLIAIGAGTGVVAILSAQ